MTTARTTAARTTAARMTAVASSIALADSPSSAPMPLLSSSLPMRNPWPFYRTDRPTSATAMPTGTARQRAEVAAAAAMQQVAELQKALAVRDEELRELRRHLLSEKELKELLGHPPLAATSEQAASEDG